MPVVWLPPKAPLMSKGHAELAPPLTSVFSRRSGSTTPSRRTDSDLVGEQVPVAVGLGQLALPLTGPHEGKLTLPLASCREAEPVVVWA